MNERVSLTTKDHIATVKMQRPDKLNALDLDMFKGLIQAAKTVRKDKSLRAVILCGDGAAFCAGLDFPSVTSRPWRFLSAIFKFGTHTNLFQEVAWCWRKLPIPVIAALHGHCLGGGLQIALAADFRLSTADCKFSILEAKWGLIPDMTATVTLRELLPMDLAKELAMTGRMFSGEEAKIYGMVSRVCVDPLLEAQKLADEIKSRSPDSVAMTKRLFHSTWHATPRRAFAIETWLQLKLLLGKNQRIAMKANFNKELPQFINRL
ncbi:MAG: crotonase/enoyl-CoA hydratase family protein [Oligoflexales bacterium]|nr:crotonase/enoyl-CoA hydratase family protein [Oligoflexales bacterium]